MRESEPPKVPEGQVNGPPKEMQAKRKRAFTQGLEIQLKAFFLLAADHGGKFFPDQDLPILLFQTELLARPNQRLPDSWVVFFQDRQKLMADAIPQEAERSVGGVFAKGDFFLPEKGFDIPAPYIEQRADKKAASPGRNAGKAAGAGPAHKAHQDQFRLVIRSVADGNFIGPPRPGRFLEKGVTGLSGRILKREVFFFSECLHVGFAREKGNAKAGGGIGHKSLFLCGFGAQAVIQVTNGQGDLRLLPKFGKGVEKSHGIGAPGDANQNAFAAGQKRMAEDGLTYLLDQ